MAPRDDKKQRRKLKPDEVLQFGPVTIVRYGRLTQHLVQWDAQQRAKMIAELPAMRAELKSKIEAAVGRAVRVAERCDPLPLVNGLFWKNCLVDMETYSEPENKKSEAVVEFAHSVVAGVQAWGTSKPAKEDFDEFEEACQEVLDATTAYFITQPPNEDADLTIEETRFLGVIRHLHLRGSSMIEHETDLLLALFAPHDAFFIRHDFPSANEFVGLCQGIMDCVNAFAKEQVDSVAQWAKYYRRYVEATDDARVDAEQELKRIKEEMAPDTKANLRAIGKDPVEAHIVPADEASRGFCRELSLSPGDNQAFLTFKKSPGWPTNDTATEMRPLLKARGQIYAINPVSLMRNRAGILEDFVRRTDSKYYQERFASVRGKVVEELALKYLKLALPSADVFPGVYYSMEVGGEVRRFEADGVATFDDYLFLLEMKAGPFSRAAMRGAPKRLVEDLDHLVAEPYEQALRTLQYLRTKAPAALENEKGQVVATIDPARFRRTYIINVTLADIGHVSARLNSARAMGLVDGKVWPWSVHVNDLRVISELVQSPAEFLLYLDRRLALNDIKAVTTIDELDYFGMFLHDGLYFEPGELSKVHRFTPMGYTVAIDRYYDFKFGRVSTGPKPTFNVSPWFRALTDMLQLQPSPGAAYVAQLLLSLDGNEHKKIENWFKEFGPSGHLQPRSMTLLSRERLPTIVLSVSAPAAPEHDQLVESYALQKRHQTGGRPLVWIAIDQSFAKATFKLFEGAIEEPDDAQRARLAVLRRSKYDAHVRAKGQPGRNDQCSCGSGEKFKRCCLQFVAAWDAEKKKSTNRRGPA